MTIEQVNRANALIQKINDLKEFIKNAELVRSSVGTDISVTFSLYKAPDVISCTGSVYPEDGEHYITRGNIIDKALDMMIDAAKQQIEHLTAQVKRIGSITEEVSEDYTLVWVNETGEYEWDVIAFQANEAAKAGSKYIFHDDIPEDDFDTRYCQYFFDHGFSTVEDDDVYQKITL